MTNIFEFIEPVFYFDLDLKYSMFIKFKNSNKYYNFTARSDRSPYLNFIETDLSDKNISAEEMTNLHIEFFTDCIKDIKNQYLKIKVQNL